MLILTGIAQYRQRPWYPNTFLRQASSLELLVNNTTQDPVIRAIDFTWFRERQGR